MRTWEMSPLALSVKPMLPLPYVQAPPAAYEANLGGAANVVTTPEVDVRVISPPPMPQKYPAAQVKSAEGMVRFRVTSIIGPAGLATFVWKSLLPLVNQKSLVSARNAPTCALIGVLRTVTSAPLLWMRTSRVPETP